MLETQLQMCDFNPHHPQGGDIYFGLQKHQPPHFNPHHPQGGDRIKIRDCSFCDISIHTTRKVVTVMPYVRVCI